MSTCPNQEVFNTLSSSFDRIEEAAWFLRLMERNYHNSNRFRWSLNAFLRSLKEVMQLVTMEAQGQKELSALASAKKSELSADPLVNYLYKQRDLIVHRSMLQPASYGSVGFAMPGRGMRLGIGAPIDPLEDSQNAILRYIRYSAKNNDFLGILRPDEDGGSEYTCVQRQWRLDKFPDQEITELAATAWERVTQTLFDVAKHLGADLIQPVFELAPSEDTQIEMYSPQWIKEMVETAASEASDLQASDQNVTEQEVRTVLKKAGKNYDS